MTKTLLKILKFLFSKELEVSPGVFWSGGYVYENRNKPQGEPPLKFKKRDTHQTGTRTSQIPTRCPIIVS